MNCSEIEIEMKDLLDIFPVHSPRLNTMSDEEIAEKIAQLRELRYVKIPRTRQKSILDHVLKKLDMENSKRVVATVMLRDDNEEGGEK